MNLNISLCASACTGAKHCSLTPTCKGWGCRFLATPIEQLPTTDKEKAKLFSKVYRAHITALYSLMKCSKI